MNEKPFNIMNMIKDIENIPKVNRKASFQKENRESKIYTPIKVKNPDANIVINGLYFDGTPVKLFSRVKSPKKILNKSLLKTEKDIIDNIRLANKGIKQNNVLHSKINIDKLKFS